MHTCFCVLLYFTACMLYYCNTVRWAWWDWGLIWWLTILLQCFDTVGWATWPVKISSLNDLYCVEWDVKPYSTQPTVLAHFQGCANHVTTANSINTHGYSNHVCSGGELWLHVRYLHSSDMQSWLIYAYFYHVFGVYVVRIFLKMPHKTDRPG